MVNIISFFKMFFKIHRIDFMIYLQFENHCTSFARLLIFLKIDGYYHASLILDMAQYIVLCFRCQPTDVFCFQDPRLHISSIKRFLFCFNNSILCANIPYLCTICNSLTTISPNHRKIQHLIKVFTTCEETGTFIHF